MSDLCLLAMVLNQASSQTLADQPGQIVVFSAPKATKRRAAQPTTHCKPQSKQSSTIAAVQPVEIDRRSPLEFSQPRPAPATPISINPLDVRPRSGIQLYWQRMTALQNGHLYTRLPIDSFYDVWQTVTGHPSYEQWRRLLTLEARAVGRGQKSRAVSVLVGDSLSQWFPSDRLPNGRIWLNQGISGDTTAGILRRLQDFASVRPARIYVMAGVNDLKNGRSDREILQNLTQIVRTLRQRHPKAQIVLQSILPTRSRLIPNARIARLNRSLATIAQRQGITYLNLSRQFQAADGYLRSELTTDGIHLNPRGYALWQTAIAQIEGQGSQTVAQR